MADLQRGAYRARYVDITVRSTDADGLMVLAILPSGQEVYLPRPMVEELYVPVLSTTASLSEEAG